MPGDPALQQAIKTIWNRNADFWDERMGEGNHFHKILIEPAQKRLLALQPEEWVLDIACGNGQFARELARLGACIVACDASERMIAHARSRTTEHVDRIIYHVIDATAREQLQTLAKYRFDAAVCTMAFMDIITLEPLLQFLPQVLKENGRFVFSECHPCFNSGEFALFQEEEDREGTIVSRHGIKVFDYILPSTKMGLAMRGQPTPHYYFHRPLSMLFDLCFQAGFVLDGLEEPGMGEHARAGKFWDDVYKNIPPALVVRLRLR
ncbi:MAG: class I SAM-dependent methyltransferase [bacterium]